MQPTFSPSAVSTTSLLRRQCRPGATSSQTLRLRRDRLRRLGESSSRGGYVLRQGDITFVLTSPLRPDHPDSRRLLTARRRRQDIALEVDDVQAAYAEATRRGANA